MKDFFKVLLDCNCLLKKHSPYKFVCYLHEVIKLASSQGKAMDSGKLITY